MALYYGLVTIIVKKNKKEMKKNETITGNKIKRKNKKYNETIIDKK